MWRSSPAEDYLLSLPCRRIISPEGRRLIVVNCILARLPSRSYAVWLRAGQNVFQCSHDTAHRYYLDINPEWERVKHRFPQEEEEDEDESSRHPPLPKPELMQILKLIPRAKANKGDINRATLFADKEEYEALVRFAENVLSFHKFLTED